MPLIHRGAKPYYYQSVRVDGRVTSRYVASGERALMFGALDALDEREARRERIRARRRTLRACELEEALRNAQRAEVERLHAEDREFKAYFDGVESIARAALRAAGFHQHDRGEWRRRMANDTSANGSVTRTGIQSHALSGGGVEPHDAFLRRAVEGDRSTLPALREFLTEAEKAGIGDSLIAAFRGDPAREAEDRLVEAWSGKNLVAQEALRRRVAQVRAELAGPDPTPIERLLAERAALCWLGVYRLEALAAPADPTKRRAVFLQKQLDGAHRRFLSSLRTLATVRRLAVPTLHGGVSRRASVTDAGPSDRTGVHLGDHGIPGRPVANCGPSNSPRSGAPSSGRSPPSVPPAATS